MAGVAGFPLFFERRSMHHRFAAWAAAFSLLLSAAAGASAQPTVNSPLPTPQANQAAPRPTVAPSVIDAHTREDIDRHQAMARAHAQAAQCLEAGKGEDPCQKQLQLACKGLALGKNCGMRHSH